MDLGIGRRQAVRLILTEIDTPGVGSVSKIQRPSGLSGLIRLRNAANPRFVLADRTPFGACLESSKQAFDILVVVVEMGRDSQASTAHCDLDSVPAQARSDLCRIAGRDEGKNAASLPR